MTAFASFRPAQTEQPAVTAPAAPTATAAASPARDHSAAPTLAQPMGALYRPPTAPSMMPRVATPTAVRLDRASDQLA